MTGGYEALQIEIKEHVATLWLSDRRWGREGWLGVRRG